MENFSNMHVCMSTTKRVRYTHFISTNFPLNRAGKLG